MVMPMVIKIVNWRATAVRTIFTIVVTAPLFLILVGIGANCNLFLSAFGFMAMAWLGDSPTMTIPTTPIAPGINVPNIERRIPGQDELVSVDVRV